MPFKSFGRKNYFKHEMRLTQLLAARPADDILRNLSDKIQPKAIETGINCKNEKIFRLKKGP